MAPPDDSAEKAVRIERLRAIVNDDYERVLGTEDPFRVLNLAEGATWKDAAARYEKYERFYRAENFQRLGDMDLTRKALDVRRAVGRAIVELQGRDDPEEEEMLLVTDVDPDSYALGNIYFRDGLTYLRLGDLDTAVDLLKRSTELDPSSAVALAYLAYTNHRRRPHDAAAIEDYRRMMQRATRMAPDDVDVNVLGARFYIKVGEVDHAVRCIEAVRAVEPDHAKLSALEKRLERVTVAT